VYELGSIFKPLTVAAALEAGTLDLSEMFNVRTPIVLRGKAITDTHEAASHMNAATILAESSNIGTVKIAQTLGATGLQDFYQRLGLLARTEVELPASARPLLPEAWTDLSIATASYGHGIAVSPLAFAATYTALGNQGMQAQLRIVETDEPPVLRRVMSDVTAMRVLEMLRGAVLDGTGRRGEAPGYRVAGKTGTAEKPIAGGYAADRNVTSFAALFPANSPEYVVLIVLDDPRVLEGDGGATAAWNAAPVAGRVIARIAPILGVRPEFDQAALEGASQRSVP
jgi:cell division protein FtsI (penicillin-binding protein 3)